MIPSISKPSLWLLLFTLLTAVSAYTKPTSQTWGPLYTPNTSDPVTQGEPFNITWSSAGHPTKGVTVSLVLCRGPSTNCVLNKRAIATGIPAAAEHYIWDVPANIRPGKAGTGTGNGMLIIVDGTGEFQYSTQFSILRKK